MSRAQGVPGSAGVGLASFLFPVFCLCFSILLGRPGAAYAPDAAVYRLLAQGQRGLVPAPFSARILGPAAAGGLGRISGLGVHAGFLLLGVLCLAMLVALIAGILRSWRAPAVVVAAIFLMPFWVDIFHDYYLPDLVHATLLAALLACLLFGRPRLALLLLFPAYLARESTILVAACLVAAGWRRIGMRTAMVGVLATLAGIAVGAHFSHQGSASIHGLTGGVYILGKMVWSFFKNVLGLPLWSNTLPECNPIWTRPLGHPFGAIRAVGLCEPSLWGPSRLVLAWFGIFGIAPAFAAVLGKRLFVGIGAQEPGEAVVLRFCVVYGSISILMTPLLGASADRLVEYGWPLCFVALPWFVSRFAQVQGAAGMLALHLLTCWLAWFGFREQSYLVAASGVLLCNGLAYGIMRHSRLSTPVDNLWIRSASDPSL